MLFLIVSLPMQSIAGVARLECGMSHHPATAGSVQQDEGPMPDMIADDAQASVHEHHEMVSQDSSQSDEDCEGSSGHKKASCGTCAACSIGACAPPPVVAVTAVEEAVSGVRQIPLSSFTGHIPARIERPPRAI